MKADISIVSMSRGRPKFLKQMWASCLEFADKPEDKDLSVYVDEDDPALQDYQIWAFHDQHVSLVIGKRPEKAGTGFNEAYKKATADIIFANTDDCFIRTPGWDTLILETFSSFEDKILLVHGNDGIQGGKLATTFFLHRNWVDTLGYVVPPFFVCECVDRWLTQIADALMRRIYLEGLVTEHMHPAHTGAAKDATTTEREAMRKAAYPNRGWRGLPSQYEPERIKDTGKLKAFIDNFGK